MHMNLTLQLFKAMATAIALALVIYAFASYQLRSGASTDKESKRAKNGAVTVHQAVAHDVSRPLSELAASGAERETGTTHPPAFTVPSQALANDPDDERDETAAQNPAAPITPPVMTSPAGA